MMSLFWFQIAAQRTDQNADVGGANRVMLAVGKGQRGTVLNVPLHAPVARLVGTELDAGQNQPGPWLQIIDQALRQPGLLLDGLFRLLLVRGQCGLQQRTVVRVLQKQQGGHAMFAIVANRAGAFAGQVVLVAIGVLEQQRLGIDFRPEPRQAVRMICGLESSSTMRFAGRSRALAQAFARGIGLSRPQPGLFENGRQVLKALRRSDAQKKGDAWASLAYVKIKEEKP